MAKLPFVKTLTYNRTAASLSHGIACEEGLTAVRCYLVDIFISMRYSTASTAFCSSVCPSSG